MTRSKLSDADKQTLVRLFQETPETINSLAQQYDVSGSTIRRILKTQLTPADYDHLLALKQQEERYPEPSSVMSPAPAIVAVVGAKPQGLEPPASSPPKPILKSEQKSTPRDSQVAPEPQPAPPPSSEDQADTHLISPELVSQAELSSQGVGDIELELEAEFPDDDLLEADLDDFESDDDLDDLDDLDEFEDDDLDDDEINDVAADTLLEVLPLITAVLPKQCYLVVDRASELITRPLQDFSNLGQIPESEVESVTLPIFDNHRIARRFSNRTQRIVKVPNGNLLQKAGAQLTAKGITRLLIRGRVYAL
ncbi:hypothetical protein GS597_05490 [Synechococcales cyanobacterium C]|uniref:Transposase n=1 Tax=Petrachloros mirabilis ULC683 TaxID=2781853 RepID=A0A8K1ZY40_9CYAN|nr:hypothetical protein [Petrachloros mirabilis]NCJ05972.1 hypothetical protein [Petrachloros mirabilis ULC683]